MGPGDPAWCRAGQVLSRRGEVPLDREVSVLCRGPVLLLHFCPGPFLGTKLHGSYASGERHLTCQLDPSPCFQKLCFAPQPPPALWGAITPDPGGNAGWTPWGPSFPHSAARPSARGCHSPRPPALCPPEGHEMRKNHLGDCIMFRPGAFSWSPRAVRTLSKF